MPNSLLSSEIRHQAQRERFGTFLVNEEIKPTARALGREIGRILSEMDFENLSRKNLNRLIKRIEKHFNAEWSAMWARITKQMNEMAVLEGVTVTDLYNDFIPETVIAPAALAIKASIIKSVMELTASSGDVKKGTWLKFTEENTDSTFKLVEKAIRTGYADTTSTNKIMQKIRGKFDRREKAFKGGILNGIATSRAKALTLTGISHFSNIARDEFAEKNKDILVSRITLITLDNKTTTICLGRNGDEYAIDDDSYPRLPFHFNERTIYVFRTPGFDPLETVRPSIGGKHTQHAENEFNRKDKKLNVIRDNRSEKRAEGLRTPETKSKVTYQGRKDNDIFQVKLISGEVSADEFFRNQPLWWLESTSLGKTRAKLFKDGNMKLNSFTDITGKQLTLKQLMKTVEGEKAFRKINKGK